MMTDIEIAQAANPLKIGEIAQAAGVDEKYLEQYGNYKAKAFPLDVSHLCDDRRHPLVSCAQIRRFRFAVLEIPQKNCITTIFV